MENPLLPKKSSLEQHEKGYIEKPSTSKAPDATTNQMSLLFNIPLHFKEYINPFGQIERNDPKTTPKFNMIKQIPLGDELDWLHHNIIGPHVIGGKIRSEDTDLLPTYLGIPERDREKVFGRPKFVLRR